MGHKQKIMNMKEHMELVKNLNNKKPNIKKINKNEKIKKKNI